MPFEMKVTGAEIKRLIALHNAYLEKTQAMKRDFREECKTDLETRRAPKPVPMPDYGFGSPHMHVHGEPSPAVKRWREGVEAADAERMVTLNNWIAKQLVDDQYYTIDRLDLMVFGLSSAGGSGAYGYASPVLPGDVLA